MRKALDAFARLDVVTAVAILREDDLIDKEFDSFVWVPITYMMEDARTISSSLDLFFLAKAIESAITQGIAELIIYIVKGADIRYADRRNRSGPQRSALLVLVVEDAGDRRADRRQPASQRFPSTLAMDGDSAQREIDAMLPDLVLPDWMLPGASGLTLAALARRPADQGRPSSC